MHAKLLAMVLAIALIAPAYSAENFVPKAAVFAVGAMPSSADRIAGTAFVIDLKNGVVLTAGHVLKKAITKYDETLTLTYYPMDNSPSTSVRANVIARGYDCLAIAGEQKNCTDWAAVRIVKEDLRNLDVLQLREIAPAMNLTGFDQALIDMKVGTIGFGKLQFPPRPKTGLVTELSPGGAAGVIRVSIEVFSGNSGGPLFDPANQAVGIVTGISISKADANTSIQLPDTADCVHLESIIMDLCKSLPPPAGATELDEFFQKKLPGRLSREQLIRLRFSISKMTTLERFKLLQMARDSCGDLVRFLFVHVKSDLPAVVAIMSELLAGAANTEWNRTLSGCTTTALAAFLKEKRTGDERLSEEEITGVKLVGRLALTRILRESVSVGEGGNLVAELTHLANQSDVGDLAPMIAAVKARQELPRLQTQFQQAQTQIAASQEALDRAKAEAAARESVLIAANAEISRIKFASAEMAARASSADRERAELSARLAAAEREKADAFAKTREMESAVRRSQEAAASASKRR